MAPLLSPEFSEEITQIFGLNKDHGEYIRKLIKKGNGKFKQIPFANKNIQQKMNDLKAK
jgi:hypothetical protein